MKPNNRGFDPEVFTVSRATRDIALLPGIGRFCVCGCGKPINGKLVKIKSHGKEIEIFKQPRFDQKYATDNCKHKIYYKNHKEKWDKIKINCSLKLRVESDDKIPYRILKLHLNKNVDSVDIKITQKSNPEIWNICEKIARYRTDPLKLEVKNCK